ncbi:MAG: N-acetyltransferase, partial [Abditibacteriota bacterium]|nr:N-acetyltransferase [Abditibacteriota bacterium]
FNAFSHSSKTVMPISSQPFLPPLLPVVLGGARARLEPLAMYHATSLLEAAQDPRIWEFMPARLESLQSVQSWIEQALASHARGEELPFAIIDQSDGRAVGSTRLCDYQAAHRNVEIGWTWLQPSVWRTRVNTESKYLLLRHCFETLKLVRVTLKADARNERSQRAIERIGGVREGVLRRHRILPEGFIRDTVYFSILDCEWAIVKAQLEKMLL